MENMTLENEFRLLDEYDERQDLRKGRRRVPPGTPAWIGCELLTLTCRDLRQIYGKELMGSEGVEVLLTIGNLEEMFHE